jgi:hypothetical protein
VNNPIHTLTDTKCFGFQFLLDQGAADCEAETHATSE